MCAKTHIYWGGEVLLSCSVSISYSQKLVGGRKGIGQIIFRVFRGIFSKACYHPEALRDWRRSFVRSRLSLWCIRRIPCILGGLILRPYGLITYVLGLALAVRAVPLGFGLRGIPSPILSLLSGLRKGNSFWKHFLLALAICIMPRLCHWGSVAGNNSFYPSGVGTPQSQLKDTACAILTSGVRTVPLMKNPGFWKIPMIRWLVSGKGFWIREHIGNLPECLFLRCPGLLPQASALVWNFLFKRPSR